MGCDILYPSTPRVLSFNLWSSSYNIISFLPKIMSFKGQVVCLFRCVFSYHQMQYPANRRKSINACFLEIILDLGPRYYQMARLWEKTQVWGVAKWVYALQACIYSGWVGSIFNFPGLSTAWTFFSNNVLFTSEDQKSFELKPCLVTYVWAVPKKHEGTLKTPEMKNMSHHKILRWTKQGNMQLYIPEHYDAEV